MSIKITKDNYTIVLKSLEDKINKLPSSEIDNINKLFQNLKRKVSELKESTQELMDENNILRIGVVGQVKAGKSSFLNSLIFNGENVLPKAATPMTAGLTILEYGDSNEFIIEYYTSSEWSKFEDNAKQYDDIINDFRQVYPEMTDAEIERECEIDNVLKSAKEMVQSCRFDVKNSKINKEGKRESISFNNINDMQTQLADYVGAEGRYTPIVKSLTIRLNDHRLKDMQIVDTPGVNDPVVSREERTRQFLSGCHGVFFLSYSGRFFDSTDVDFLVQRIGSQGIGTVVVIASKYDSVLQDAGMKYKNDLSGADNYCQSSLKKQLSNNVRNSDYHGNFPKFTVSSGIGFAIAHKTPERWDSTEKHVVERMRSYYPDQFSDTDSINETFKVLSQIDEINEDFVNNTFLKNKEDIIKSKIESFMASMSSQLKMETSEAYRRICNWIDKLQNGDINEIESREKNMTKSLEFINRKLNLYSNTFNSELKRLETELYNSASIEVYFCTKTESRTFQRISTSIFSRNKGFEHSFNDIDVVSTKMKAKDKLESVLSDLSRKWDDGINGIRKDFLDKIDSFIVDLERDDKENHIDADLLRDTINDAYSTMGGLSVLPIRDLKDMSSNILSNLDNNIIEINTLLGKMDESAATAQIDRNVNNRKRQLQKNIANWQDEISENIANTIRNKINEIRNIITENKSVMIDKAQNDITESLEGLKAELANRKHNLEIYKNSANQLKSVIEYI